MRELLKRLLVPGAFLAIFIVTISALQAQKNNFEHARRDSVIAAVSLLEHGSIEDISRHFESGYWDGENSEANRKVIDAYKEQLTRMGRRTIRYAPVFSVRSERIPTQADMTSDIYIMHVDYEKGEMIYTLGVVNSESSSAANWVADRLTIAVLPQAEGADKSEFKLSILCSEEKKISKKCRKN